ncbi:UNVERIFIED_CONTAM: Pentatricopeptide repeat-containing protein [Sesamum latifolium]|uniref:Pentatricopeptide repeat-containing protein n=1 Tax=Sesamum latifolium TaxID=2727402 RepID=A0AAW2Y9W8_9LAMI
MRLHSSILSCCNHGGLVEERARHFVNMYKVHGIRPTMVHRSCIVSMLARGGYLDEAHEYINSWRLNDPILWCTLLSACVHFGNLKLGIHAADTVKDNVNDSTAHVLLND